MQSISKAIALVQLSVLSLLIVSKAGASSPLIRSQELRINSKTSTPAIIYGNPEVGFFQAKNLVQKNKGVWEIRFFPPSYKLPIYFYEQINNQRREILKKSYPPPPQHPPAIKMQVRGKLSFPFLLTDIVTESTQPPSYYPVAINRLGEIVWYDKSHLTPTRDLVSSSNLSLLPWQDGLFIRGAGLNSYWNLVPWQGDPTPLRQVELDGHRLDAHHSMGASDKEVYFWTALIKKISPFKDTIPVFSGLTGWFRAWGEEDRIVVGNRLVGLNPASGAVRSIVTTFDITSPTKSPSRSLDENVDRFQDAKTTEEYRQLKTVNDPEFYISEKYDTDWSHENAVDVTAEGNFLITMRNLNSVILLSPTGKIIWSLGNEKFSTHKWDPNQTSLGLPHSARWIGDNRIVVFDNAAPYRGMVKLAPQSRVVWLKLMANGKIEIEKEVIMPGDKSLTKGSVRPLNTKGFLIWHPGPHTGVAQCVETDSSGNIVGHLSMEWPGYKKHDEALALYNLGDAAIDMPDTDKKIIYLDSKHDEEVY